MARSFNGCKGKTLCRENGTECRTCGRSLDEIYTTRRLIGALADFIGYCPMAFIEWDDQRFILGVEQIG